MIVCRGLTRRFGALTAVNCIDLAVAEGELFGFLGPNGAGKTTTIKLLTGLLRPTSGEVRLGGFDICRQPIEAKRIFGYIPDNPYLYEKLTGLEYLHFMADLYSVPTQGRQRRIADLLELLELEDKGGSLIGGYSRGMRQKIALAGALIHSPRIVFLDEPTVGLDPRGARAMRDILRELCRRDVTVFMSTHILETAERMCGRMAIVNRGSIIAMGALDALREAATAGAPPGSRTEAAAGSAPPGATGESAASLEEIFLQLTDERKTADLERLLGVDEARPACREEGGWVE